MASLLEHPFWQNIKEFKLYKAWRVFLLLLVNVLVSVPIFLILHQNIIEFNWPFYLDRILLAVVILGIVQLLLHISGRAVLYLMALYIIYLIYGSFSGGYGFDDVFEDYNYMVYSMSNSPHPQDIIVSKLLPFPNKNKTLKAIEFNHPNVRNFALMCTTKHFKDIKYNSSHRKMVQCFAVFKEIRNRWNYVNDPKGKEYIATASESLLHFSGDCDDHAVLMAASIRSIGGIPRLIHTDGHIYPEMLIGTKADLEAANYLIKEVLFPQESKGKEIHFHIDERGQIWLNLDYTARYPGGPFMRKEILGALTLN